VWIRIRTTARNTGHSSWPTSDTCRVKKPDTCRVFASIYPTLSGQVTRHATSHSNFKIPTSHVGYFPSSYPTSFTSNNPTRQSRLQITRHVGSSNPTSKVHVGQVTRHCRPQVTRHHIGFKKSDTVYRLQVTQLRVGFN